MIFQRRSAAGFELPEMDRDTDYLSLSHPDQYALNYGNVKTFKGAEFQIEKFLDFVDERQVEHSNALQCRLKLSGTYQTGPLARVNNNHDQLSKTTKELLNEVGASFPSQNPFMSIIARGAEILTGIVKRVRLIPPTTQNLARMEDDLMMFAPRLLEKSREELSPSTWCVMFRRVNESGPTSTPAPSRKLGSFDPQLSSDLNLLGTQGYK